MEFVSSRKALMVRDFGSLLCGAIFGFGIFVSGGVFSSCSGESICGSKAIVALVLRHVGGALGNALSETFRRFLSEFLLEGA